MALWIELRRVPSCVVDESPTAAAIGTAVSVLHRVHLPGSHQTASDVAVTTVAVGKEGCGLWAVLRHQGTQVEHLHKSERKDAMLHDFSGRTYCPQ